jgi:hypothetical protein
MTKTKEVTCRYGIPYKTSLSDTRGAVEPYRKGAMGDENVRRLLIRAKKLVTEAAKHIIFEQKEGGEE